MCRCAECACGVCTCGEGEGAGCRWNSASLDGGGSWGGEEEAVWGQSVGEAMA